MSQSSGICHGVSDGIAMKSSMMWGNVRLCHGDRF